MQSCEKKFFDPESVGTKCGALRKATICATIVQVAQPTHFGVNLHCVKLFRPYGPGGKWLNEAAEARKPKMYFGKAEFPTPRKGHKHERNIQDRLEKIGENMRTMPEKIEAARKGHIEKRPRSDDWYDVLDAGKWRIK